jgi:hypothetical protein
LIPNTRRFDEKENAELAAKPKTSPFYMGIEQARIAIHIVNVNLQLIFDLNKPILLGRSVPPSPDVTALDLTPFRAEELGVSRRHLTMQVYNKKLTITDNNSLNGSFLNGKLIEPDAPYMVTRGDEITVGRLRVDFIAGFAY